MIINGNLVEELSKGCTFTVLHEGSEMYDFMICRSFGKFEYVLVNLTTSFITTSEGDSIPEMIKPFIENDEVYEIIKINGKEVLN